MRNHPLLTEYCTQLQTEYQDFPPKHQVQHLRNGRQLAKSLDNQYFAHKFGKGCCPRLLFLKESAVFLRFDRLLE